MKRTDVMRFHALRFRAVRLRATPSLGVLNRAACMLSTTPLVCSTTGALTELASGELGESQRTDVRSRIHVASREFSLRILGLVSTVESGPARRSAYFRVAPSCQVTEHSVRTQGEVRRQLSPSPARPRLS